MRVRGPYNVSLKHGDEFTTKDGVTVKVKTWVSATEVVVEDSDGNTKTTRATTLRNGKLVWNWKGTFRPSRRDVAGPPIYKRVPVRQLKETPLLTVGSYVYIVSIRGEIVYVGQGKGERMRHCISGISGNRELNRAYFNKEPMIAEVYKQGMNREEALELEKQLIKELKPRFNVRIPSSSPKTE